MPTKTIYVKSEMLSTWDEADALASRRKLSMSELISNLLRDYVRDYGAAAAAGLPAGFAVPASMKAPEQVAREQLANEVRDLVLGKLNEGAAEVKAS